jgi:hypothetical protein
VRPPNKDKGQQCIDTCAPSGICFTLATRLSVSATTLKKRISAISGLASYSFVNICHADSLKTASGDYEL